MVPLSLQKSGEALRLSVILYRIITSPVFVVFVPGSFQSIKPVSNKKHAFMTCLLLLNYRTQFEDEEEEEDEDEPDEEDLLRSCSMWISVTRIATTSFSYCG